MKKTPFVTVNLRKSVYAAHAAVFAFSVCICCIASRSVRPISIGKTLTNAIISADSCAAIQAEASAPTLFSAKRRTIPKTKTRSRQQNQFRIPKPRQALPPFKPLFRPHRYTQGRLRQAAARFRFRTMPGLPLTPRRFPPAPLSFSKAAAQCL